MWLKKEDFVVYAPEGVGTVQKWHCKEGKGNDRLFITRMDDGHTILAYCHHCGAAGKHNAFHSMTKADMERFKKVPKSSSGMYTLPTDLVSRMSEWPVHASQWLASAYIGQKEANQYRITYSPDLGRVVIPVFTAGRLSMFQTRRVLSSDKGPKYLTYKNFDGLPFRVFGGTDKSRLIIVEDALSCIRCGEWYPSIALMGTHLTDVMLAMLVKTDIPKFIIYLDDDNLEVREQQLRVKRRLETFGQVVVVHADGIDPKCRTRSNLRDILESA
jgi:hypothetical protein